MSRKRNFTPSRERLRNLKQYKDLTDNEFESWYQESFPEKENVETVLVDLNSLIDLKLKELEKDYDFTEMKWNDQQQLRALCMAMIQLEDLELKAYVLRQDISEDSMLNYQKLNQILSALRSDISTISNDLQLTKRVRNQSKDTSIANRWDELLKKASRMYKDKMLYIFCPECKQLLATTWLHYADNDNVLKLHCGHCANVFEQELKGLYSKGNKNLASVLTA